MNALVWTLWLVNWSPSVSMNPESNAPAVVTPLATYTTGTECYAAINTIQKQLKDSFEGVHPAPGMMICVPGTPVKR